MASERPPRDVAAEAHDEERDGTDSLRPGYAQAFAALDGIDLDELCRAVAEHLRRDEVSFGGESFVVDPIPRLIPGDEWDRLAAGLAQRGRALNHFLRDAYGERRIVSAGVIPADVIDDAEGFEPDLVGRLPSLGAPAAIIGFDLVRDPDGEFLVLEDNLAHPRGTPTCWRPAGRSATCFPTAFRGRVPIEPRDLRADRSRSARCGARGCRPGSVHGRAHRRSGQRGDPRARAGRVEAGAGARDAGRPRSRPRWRRPADAARGWIVAPGRRRLPAHRRGPGPRRARRDDRRRRASRAALAARARSGS